MLGGTGRIEITPPEGCLMGGYAARSRPAKSVHDPLYARALVLGDGDRRIAIVACDLLGIEPATALDVRRRVEAHVGIPVSHTMLCCSHTHAGPLAVHRRATHVAAAYLDGLRDKVLQVVGDAARNMAPVRVGAGRAKVYLGVNRRERDADGAVKLGKNPNGYAWPYVHALLVSAEQGAPRAVLFTYGAHPVVLGPENLAISGDYVGLAGRRVEENFGGRATALFALGFAGNVDVGYERRTFAELETTGVALSRAVLETLKGIEPVGGLALGARSVRVPLPLEPPPTVLEAERMLFEERDRLSRILGRAENEAQVNTRRLMVEWASDLVRLAREGQADPAVDAELQVLTIGGIGLVALSAEVFAEYAKMLDAMTPFDHTFPISNANGSVGYIPTAAAFEEGGYEVDDAPRLTGVLRFRPEVEQVVMGAMTSLLAEMSGGSPSPDEGAP